MKRLVLLFVIMILTLSNVSFAQHVNCHEQGLSLEQCREQRLAEKEARRIEKLYVRCDSLIAIETCGVCDDVVNTMFNRLPAEQALSVVFDTQCSNCPNVQLLMEYYRNQ